MNQNNWRRGQGTGRAGGGPDPEEGAEVLVINERELRAFIFQVYSSSVVLCLLSYIPLIILSALDVEVFKRTTVPPYVWCILAFFIITVLCCIPPIPALTLLRWGLALGFVFFLTLFGTYFIPQESVWLLLVVILVAGVLLALLHLYGAKSPEIMLPNFICIFCIYMLLLITSFVLIILFLVIKDWSYLLGVLIILVINVFLMAPFEASFICGRLQLVPYGNTVGCAIRVYMHFNILVGCMFGFAFYYEEVNN